MRHAGMWLLCALAIGGCRDSTNTSDGPAGGGDLTMAGGNKDSGGGGGDGGGGDMAMNAPIDMTVMFDSGCALGAKMCNNQCVAADPANGCGGVGCAPCPTAPANSVVDCAAGACSFTCNAGFGDCNGNAADGCEQDVSKDPANCGSCGFACPQGAMCVNGACQLVMPGTGSDQACLTIDANTIYWTTANANPGAVYSVPKNGGNPTQIIAGQMNPRGVAVDATSIYFTTTGSGEILKCPLAGCGNNPTVLANNQSTPFGITVDANNVYWTNRIANG